jgi:HK97 family phage prohead protease
MGAPTAARRSLLPAEVSVREDSGSRVIRFLASTDKVARDGGIIEPEGWETRSFEQAHPVLLWAHQADSLPLGRAVHVEKGKDGLRIDVEFAGSAQGHPFADTVYKMYREGFLKAVSVGFRVLEEREPTEQERAAGARWIATRAELLELSAVPVPADTGAVALDTKRLAAVFTRADLSVVKGLEAVEPMQPFVRALEAALLTLPTITTVTPPITVASSTTTRAVDPSLLTELHDLLQRSQEILGELAREDDPPRGEGTNGREGQEPPAPSPVVGVRPADASAPADGWVSLLDVIEKHSRNNHA